MFELSLIRHVLLTLPRSNGTLNNPIQSFFWQGYNKNKEMNNMKNKLILSKQELQKLERLESIRLLTCIYPLILPKTNNDNMPMSPSPLLPFSENAHSVYFLRLHCWYGRIAMFGNILHEKLFVKDGFHNEWNHLIQAIQWLPARCRLPLGTAKLRKKFWHLIKTLYWTEWTYCMVCSYIVISDTRMAFPKRMHVCQLPRPSYEYSFRVNDQSWSHNSCTPITRPHMTLQ